MRKNIIAIVISYNSDVIRFSDNLKIISKQCEVVVVDNSTSMEISNALKDICNLMKVTIISLGDNYGIAFAQNRGVEWAKKNNATDILLMDDDSTPSITLVSDLLKARDKFFSSIVISARAIDSDGTEIYSGFNSSDTIKCTELMSSGTLIPLPIFESVGHFDESLFIDCVDYEWGWRAISKDYSLYIAKNAIIKHRLGEGRQMSVRMPSPIRHYYQYRNVLKMIFSSDANMRWRISQVFKLPIKLILILIFADRRYERINYALKGIGDFLNSRYGKLNLKDK